MLTCHLCRKCRSYNHLWTGSSLHRSTACRCKHTWGDLRSSGRDLPHRPPRCRNRSFPYSAGRHHSRPETSRPWPTIPRHTTKTMLFVLTSFSPLQFVRPFWASQPLHSSDDDFDFLSLLSKTQEGTQNRTFFCKKNLGIIIFHKDQRLSRPFEM